MGQSSPCQPINFAVKNGASFQAIETAAGSPADTTFSSQEVIHRCSAIAPDVRELRCRKPCRLRFQYLSHPSTKESPDAGRRTRAPGPERNH